MMMMVQKRYEMKWKKVDDMKGQIFEKFSALRSVIADSTFFIRKRLTYHETQTVSTWA